ncbi:hypothetical protein [Sulfitobacter geojensis]|uniref:hypothetical protein n=1 Tax=Sulfitobacter geojensis TaxID=1342299 RepID=UPI003B8B6228
MNGFIHDATIARSTVDEIRKLYKSMPAETFFGCYAYATQSGFRTFDIGIDDDFWKKTQSRWLFGIDYGRSDPRALKEVAKQKNSEVRIYDGEYVLNSSGFIPRRDYHPKVAIMGNSSSGAEGMVLGSGNFSYNGLQRSVEAAVTTLNLKKSISGTLVTPVKEGFELLWKNSCPLDDVISEYEVKLDRMISDRDSARPKLPAASASGFWIEAGYVTKNRGPNKPGNQIFAPTGFRKYFGLSGVKSGSTLIGTISFETPEGNVISKNYRENDNGMEKLTLPMPEENGFGVYDGKILVFVEKAANFFLVTLEPAEFERVYGYRLHNVDRMGGGRRYGEFL